jgi:glycerol dehydrogenase
LKKVLGFCLDVGLPVCLEDLGIVNPTRKEIRDVAEATTAAGETIHATWFTVTADHVEAAIWAADAIGKNFKKNREV